MEHDLALVSQTRIGDLLSPSGLSYVSTKQAAKTTTRQRVSADFNQQAVARAAKEGVSSSAHGLGLEPAQLDAWHGKAQQQGEGLTQQRLTQSELARRKRESARSEETAALLKEAAAYFAKQPK